MGAGRAGAYAGQDAVEPVQDMLRYWHCLAGDGSPDRRVDGPSSRSFWGSRPASNVMAEHRRELQLRDYVRRDKYGVGECGEYAICESTVACCQGPDNTILPLHVYTTGCFQARRVPRARGTWMYCIAAAESPSPAPRSVPYSRFPPSGAPVPLTGHQRHALLRESRANGPRPPPPPATPLFPP